MYLAFTQFDRKSGTTYYIMKHCEVSGYEVVALKSVMISES